MVKLHEYADAKLHLILARFLELPYYGFGMRPVGWWYYKIKAEVNQLDNTITTSGINQRYPLTKVKSVIAVCDSLRVSSTSELYIIVKDFIIDWKTLYDELNSIVNDSDEDSSDIEDKEQISSIFTSLSSKVVSSKSIGQKVELCTYADGTIILKRKGRNIALKHQFDKVESGFHKRKGGEVYAICVKNGKKYKLYIVDFFNDRIEEIEEIKEMKETIKVDDIHMLLEQYYMIWYNLIYN